MTNVHQEIAAEAALKLKKAYVEEFVASEENTAYLKECAEVVMFAHKKLNRVSDTKAKKYLKCTTREYLNWNQLLVSGKFNKDVLRLEQRIGVRDRYFDCFQGDAISTFLQGGLRQIIDDSMRHVDAVRGIEYF